MARQIPKKTVTLLAAFAMTAIALPFVVGCTPEPSETIGPETAAATDIPPRAFFTEVATSSGIEFTHSPGKWGSYFMPEIMSGGVALLDYDSDGDLDLYFVTGFRSQFEQSVAGEPGTAGVDRRSRNRLFRQEDGGTFVDVSEGSGLDDAGFGMGVAVGDINNDGLPDVYVTNYGADRLFLNAGKGTFVDITEEAGIDNRRWGASTCFVDYDRDGRLDLYVANYVDYQPGKHCLEAQGHEEYCSPKMFAGTPDKLYRNLGSAGAREERAGIRFADESGAAGIAGKLGAGLGVVSADFNQDGWPDLFVANDGEANFLWMNQQDGTFSEEAILLGAAYDRLGRGQASMGIAVADLNDDASQDLLLTHLEGETNTLYLSTPHGFRDASVPSGISSASFPYTGFGVVYLDVEHDGDLDLAVANGRIRRRLVDNAVEQHFSTEDSANPWLPYSESNQLLLNNGQGKFQAPPASRDAFVRGREVTRALAEGDIDNDGDLDLVAVNIAGPARLYRNDSQKAGNWLNLRAIDPRYGGRDAYGAVIEIDDGKRTWRRVVNPGSSYLSSHDPRVHFGLGELEEVDGIDVVWPDGAKEHFPGGPVNKFRTITRGEGVSP